MRLLLLVLLGTLLLTPTVVVAPNPDGSPSPDDAPAPSEDQPVTEKSVSSMQPVPPLGEPKPPQENNQNEQESLFTPDDAARFIQSCVSFAGEILPVAQSAEPHFCEAFALPAGFADFRTAVAAAPRGGAPRDDEFKYINRLALNEARLTPPSTNPRPIPLTATEPLVDDTGACVRGECPTYGVLPDNPSPAGAPVVAAADPEPAPAPSSGADDAPAPAPAPADAEAFLQLGARARKASATEDKTDVDVEVDDADTAEETDKAETDADAERHHHHRHRRHRRMRQRMMKGASAADGQLSPQRGNDDGFGFAQSQTANPMLPAAQKWTAGIVPWNFVPAGMVLSPDVLNQEVVEPPPAVGSSPGLRINAPIAMSVWEQATCVWYQQSPTTGVRNHFLLLSAPRSTRPAGMCATRANIANDATNTQVMWMSDPAKPAVFNYDPAGGVGTWTFNVPGPTIVLNSDWWWNQHGAEQLKAAMQHAFGCEDDNVDVTAVAVASGGGFLVKFRPWAATIVITSVSVVRSPSNVQVDPHMVSGVAVPNEFRVRSLGAGAWIEFGLTVTLPARVSDPLSPGMTRTAIETAIDTGFGPAVTVTDAPVGSGRVGFDLTFNKGRFRGMNMNPVLVAGVGGTIPTAAPTSITLGAGAAWPNGCTPPDIAHELGHGLGHDHTQSRPDFAARGASLTAAQIANFPFRLVGTCPLDSQYETGGPWVQEVTYPGKSEPLTKRESLIGSIMLYDSGIEVTPWTGMNPADLVILTANLHAPHNTLGKIDKVLTNRYYSCFPIPFVNAAATGGHDRLWSHVEQPLRIWRNKLRRELLTGDKSVRFVPNARQSIVFSGRPASFKLTFDLWETPAIPFDTNTEQLSLNIRDGLTDLANGREVFTKAVGNLVHVTFLGRWAGQPFPAAMTCSVPATVRVVKPGGTDAAVRDKFAVGLSRMMGTAFAMTEFGDFAAIHTTMTVGITLTLRATSPLGFLFGLLRPTSVPMLIEPLWTLEEFKFAIEDRLADVALPLLIGLELNGAPLVSANPTDTITTLNVVAGVTVVADLP